MNQTPAQGTTNQAGHDGADGKGKGRQPDVMPVLRQLKCRSNDKRREQERKGGDRSDDEVGLRMP